METIQIKDPVYAEMTVHKDRTDIQFITADGIKEFSVPISESSEVQTLNFSIGDTSGIGWGGTDNWGKDVYPIELGYQQGSNEGDSVFVDTIDIQEVSDWCKCELVNNGKAVRYTALSENPSKDVRTAYFVHKTTDDTIKRGYAIGRPAAKSWYVTVTQDANPNVYPGPEPGPTPPEPTPTTSFDDMLSKFNDVLSSTGHNTVDANRTSRTSKYLMDCWTYADKEYSDPQSVLFSKDTYPEVYNYRGDNAEYETTAYNAMQAWLMAMCLTELCPSHTKSGGMTATNTQTELFKVGYELGGGRDVPLYKNYTMHGDVTIARLAAGAVYSLVRKEYTFADMNAMRNEIKGSSIKLSTPFDSLNFWDPSISYDNPIWHEMDCKTSSTKVPSEVIPGYNDTKTRSLDRLGYAVNTNLIFPNTPGPKIAGTNAASNTHPQNHGQLSSQFNQITGNYVMDETIDAYITENYNMMDSSLIDQWDAYPEDMKTRMLQTAATVSCTHRFMFWPENKLDFQGLQDYQYSTSPEYKIFRFAQGSQIPLKGPFSMHSNVCHYYSCSDAALKDYATAMGEIMTQYTLAEKYIDSVTCCADNFRYPTYCEQYGRRRPGTADNLNGRPGRSSIPANKLNEIYNLDIAQMVSDDRWGSNKRGVGKEDGLACDSPTSYPSGHSAQIWALAMILSSMHPENLQTYMSEAYKYSVNRTIGRYHWNSDCMYGRLFGTITLPLINAVNVMEDGYKALKDAVDQEPVEGNWNVKLYINNKTGKDIQSTGEIRLYVLNHIGVNMYLPGAAPNAGALYMFKTGMNDFSSLDVHCVMNGETYMDDKYEGSKITDVRFYDQRHYNNVDAGFNITLDTSEPRCDTVLKKSGATYVLKITNANEPEPEPQPEGDWNVNLYIKNDTGRQIQSTGEIRMYVRNHIGVNTYLPGAAANAGALYTFKTGTNDFTSRDVHCVMNGEAYMDDSYNGAKITEVRFYDYRHYNNIDAGFNIALDTSDSKCDTVLKKSGATYVLRITNL